MAQSFGMAQGRKEITHIKRQSNEEKIEMQFLNNCLAEYIDAMRALSKAAKAGIDPNDYKESLLQLEKEVLRLKQLYEDEINRLRKALEANKDELMDEKKRNAELLLQLAECCASARRLENENQSLIGQLADSRRLIEDLHAKMVPLSGEAKNAQKWRVDNDDILRKLNDEIRRRQAAENCARKDKEKQDFRDKIGGQRINELEERVRVQQDIINSLEKRVKELSQYDDNLPDSLKKLREENADEIKTFKKACDATMAKNLDMLYDRISADKVHIEKLVGDIRNLEDRLRTQQNKGNDLEAKNVLLTAENRDLLRRLKEERDGAKKLLDDAEDRMNKLQDQLNLNSKLYVNVRDTHASLRNEINVYRNLIAQERLKLNGKDDPILQQLQSRAKNTSGQPIDVTRGRYDRVDSYTPKGGMAGGSCSGGGMPCGPGGRGACGAQCGPTEYTAIHCGDPGPGSADAFTSKTDYMRSNAWTNGGPLTTKDGCSMPLKAMCAMPPETGCTMDVAVDNDTAKTVGTTMAPRPGCTMPAQGDCSYPPRGGCGVLPRSDSDMRPSIGMPAMPPPRDCQFPPPATMPAIESFATGGGKTGRPRGGCPVPQQDVSLTPISQGCPAIPSKNTDSRQRWSKQAPLKMATQVPVMPDVNQRQGSYLPKTVRWAHEGPYKQWPPDQPKAGLQLTPPRACDPQFQVQKSNSYSSSYNKDYTFTSMSKGAK